MRKLQAITIAVVVGIGIAGIANAARNGSGSYSLPAGNPVVSHTTISSSTFNSTMNDLAAELTNSLDRNGRGGMLAALKEADGTAGAPSFTFSNEPASGLYRATLNDVALSVAGAKRVEWTTSGEAVSGTFSTTGNSTVGGTLGVTGATTLSSTLGVTGATTLSSTLGVTGATTLSGATTISNASGGVTGLPSPVNASDATTKSYVDNTAYVVSGFVNSAGTILAQRGAVTASVTSLGAGAYTLTVPGLTGNAVVLVALNATGACASAVPSAGSAQVNTWTCTTGAGANFAFSFLVAKL